MSTLCRIPYENNSWKYTENRDMNIVAIITNTQYRKGSMCKNGWMQWHNKTDKYIPFKQSWYYLQFSLIVRLAKYILFNIKAPILFTHLT